MKISKPQIILSIFLLSCACAIAQTTSGSVEIVGNLNIKDDPDTASVKEGNLRVGGSLVVSDSPEADAYATGKNSIAAGPWGKAIGDGSIAISVGESDYWSA